MAHAIPPEPKRPDGEAHQGTIEPQHSVADIVSTKSQRLSRNSRTEDAHQHHQFPWTEATSLWSNC